MDVKLILQLAHDEAIQAVQADQKEDLETAKKYYSSAAQHLNTVHLLLLLLVF